MAEPLRIYKALADETRLRLARLLLRGPLNVNEIIDVLQMGQSRVSRHLKILSEAGLVASQRQGTWIYYQADRDAGEPLAREILALLLRHERSLPRYTEDLQGLEAIIERRREKTRSFFDSITDPDELHQCLNGEFYRRVALSLLPEHCQVALDLGTGSGLLLPELLGRAARVIAVDASRTMLELARQTAGEGASRCDFRLGDLAHLPVADGEVDTVVACMVLHHVSHPAEALAEAWRALRPGGQLGIVDLYQHDDESLRERLADLWLGFSPEEVEGWLRSLDFEILDAKVIGSPVEGGSSGASDETDSFKLITFRGRKR
jgi:ArsR family transcriptional regulator